MAPGVGNFGSNFAQERSGGPSALRENVCIGQSNAKLKIFVLNVRHICAMPKTAKKT